HRISRSSEAARLSFYPARSTQTQPRRGAVPRVPISTQTSTALSMITSELSAESAIAGQFVPQYLEVSSRFHPISPRITTSLAMSDEVGEAPSRCGGVKNSLLRYLVSAQRIISPYLIGGDRDFFPAEPGEAGNFAGYPYPRSTLHQPVKCLAPGGVA